MAAQLYIQGRLLKDDDFATIRNLIASHPDWHRTRISQELCRYWRWINEKGALKDIAARSLLRKLDSMGLIELPAPVCSANNEYRNQPVVFESSGHATAGIQSSLSSLQPILIQVVENPRDKRLFRSLLQQYHYLGYSGPVGENMQYIIHDCHNRLLGCILYGAAAWKIAARDRFIGWNDNSRQQGLSRVANNMRFLILPWVQVPHLASHILSLSRKRLSSDWQEKYGHPILLLETFVEKNRFNGTCYKADNWIWAGETTGRTRNNRTGRPTAPVKSVWLYPLCRRFRKLLKGMGEDAI